MLWGRRVWDLDDGEGKRPGGTTALCPRKTAGSTSYFPNKRFRARQPFASRVGVPAHGGWRVRVGRSAVGRATCDQHLIPAA